MSKYLCAKVKEQGWCCIYGWMQMRQNKKQRGNPKYSARYIGILMDVSTETMYRYRRLMDNGELHCEGQAKCLKNLWLNKRERAEDDDAHIGVTFPVMIVQVEPEPGVFAHLVTSRDFPELELEVPASEPLDATIVNAITTALENRIERLQDVPSGTRPLRGERLLGIVPAFGRKLADYKVYLALVKRRLRPHEMG